MNSAVEFIWIVLYTWVTMNEQVVKTKRKRRPPRAIVWFLRILAGIGLVFRDKIQKDAILIVLNSRLFIGILLIALGLLSFESDKYCDGNSSNYYACTRPSTYYYYPWWATLLVVVGSFSIVLWFLRKK